MPAKSDPFDETRIPELSVGDLFSRYAAQETTAIALELQKREQEALALFEPLPWQEKYLESRAKECAIIAGNQSGKSMVGFVEVARAVTGQDPHGKYPAKNGVCICLGMDVDHIGLVIYRYLFEPGAFHILRDGLKWRAYRPWLAEDRARKKEVQPAPPLISPRFMKNIAWEKKGEHIFSVCELTTGWKIYAMGSKGDPKQGFQADLVDIDEDLERSDWYAEMLGRLTMREGKLRWHALPHVKNDALVNLIERAEDQEHEAEEARRRGIEVRPPSTVVVRATVFDNPFQDEETRRQNIERWKQEGEDVYRKRALGELTTDSVLMYPTFTRAVHGLRLDPALYEGAPPLLDALLLERGGLPPDDWCRYMIVDPGHQVCAALFVAVPPPAIGDYKVVYDELYLTHCDARRFGEQVALKARDQVFQAFIIDAHGGALTDIGSGVSPREQYSARLKEHGILSTETKHNFLSGCDDIAGRTMLLRDWMYIRAAGTPKLRVLSDRCPNLLREFTRYRKKKIKNVVVDEPDLRSPCHAIQCLEYAAAHGLRYVKPKARPKQQTLVDRVAARRRRASEKRSAMALLSGNGPSIHLGPQGSS